MTPASPVLARWAPAWSAPEWVRGRVVVGCSGGPDSLALVALAVERGLDVVAVHVDHGLRPGSEQEAGLVAGAAAPLGAGVVGVRVEVGQGPGLEARARGLRLAALEREASLRGASAVLLGHTADDQAETVLLNLLRGSGSTGLAGMPAARRPFARPLLGLRRSDTVEICARLGLAPFHDPMNDDVRFRRVWLRREVIPFLESGTGADLRARLARQASLVRDESDLLDELADRELHALGSGPGSTALPASVGGLRPALARRAVRRWLGAGGAPPTEAMVETVLGVARGHADAAELGGGLRVERTGGVLHRVEPPVLPIPRFSLPAPGSGSGGGWSIESWVERGAPVAWPDGRLTCVIDADVAGSALRVAPADDGERFRPLGLEGSKSLMGALADAGVPPALRARHPVVRDGAGTPLWVVGYRVAAPAGVTPRTRRYLWLRATPPARVAGRGAGLEDPVEPRR